MIIRSVLKSSRVLMVAIFIVSQVTICATIYAGGYSREADDEHRAKNQLYEFAPAWIIDASFNAGNQDRIAENPERYNDLEYPKESPSSGFVKSETDSQVKPDLQMKTSPQASDEPTVANNPGLEEYLEQFRRNQIDMTGDGIVSPIDALYIVNMYNSILRNQWQISEESRLMLDQNNDGVISVEDGEMAINRILDYMEDSRLGRAGDKQSYEFHYTLPGENTDLLNDTRPLHDEMDHFRVEGEPESSRMGDLHPDENKYEIFDNSLKDIAAVYAPKSHPKAPGDEDSQKNLSDDMGGALTDKLSREREEGESRIKTGEEISDGAVRVAENNEYVDKATLEELEDMAQYITAREAMREAFRNVDFDSVKKAFEELLAAKTKAYEEFVLEGASYYDAMITLLMGDITVWWDREDMSPNDYFKGNKIKVVEFAIKRLKAKYGDGSNRAGELLKAEAGLAASRLAPARDAYAKSLRVALKDFLGKTDMILKDVKNASIKETGSGIQAVFSLPQD